MSTPFVPVTPLFKRRDLAYLVVALAAIIISGSYVVLSLHKSTPPSNVAPLSTAQSDAELAKLTTIMRQKGVEVAFGYAETQINSNPSYAKSCHPLLHELGHEAFKFYGSYGAAIQYQNEICDSGYTHGVVEEYLSGPVHIQEALQTACDPATESFAQWQCYHGLGHGIMLVSDKNVGKSLGMCNTLPTAFSKNACTNGVFMQHFVVTDHDGSVPKANPTSLGDCASQQTAYKSVCYSYAPTAYLTINDGQYKAALKWCGGAEAKYVTACIDGVGAQAMKDNIRDISVAKKVCQAAPKQYVGGCVGGAVGMYIFFYASAGQAQGLCSTQYKDYSTVCQRAITVQKQELHL